MKEAGFTPVGELSGGGGSRMARSRSFDGVGVSTGAHGCQVWVQKCTGKEAHSLLQDRKDIAERERMWI